MNFSRSWMYGNGTAAVTPIPTSPFIQEVTVAAPDVVRIEIRDPIIQRGLKQDLTVSDPGTDEQWTTRTHPITGLPASCMPLGHPGYLLTLRFDDIIPTQWYNRAAGDILSDWSIDSGLSFTRITRRSYPYCEGTSHALNASQTASRHYVYLQLAAPLISGTSCIITPPAGTGLPQINFTFDDRVTRCPGLLSNQAGHRPNDSSKIGVLAHWIPGFPNEGQVDYTGAYGISTFNIIDKNGTIVDTIAVGSTNPPSQVEQGDNNGTGITAISWLSGQVIYTVANSIAVGEDFTIFGTAPAGFSGTFTALAGTTNAQLVASMAVNPGTATNKGTLGNLRCYASASQPRARILGIAFTNPGVITTDIPLTNGMIVKLLNVGKGIAVTNAVWSSANGGQIVFTVANTDSGGQYTAGNWVTFSQFSPSGYNLSGPCTAANSSTITMPCPVDPGSHTVLGVMGTPADRQIAPTSGNTSNFFIVANATTSPNTCTLKQMVLPTLVAGADVNFTGLGPWGPGSFLTETSAASLNADLGGGYGFDSLVVPCYRSNRTGTYVTQLDYSALTSTDLPSSGSPYRIQIPGVGVSDDIPITEGKWYQAAANWLKGIYHQTSGNIDGRFGFTRPAGLQDGLNGCEVFNSYLPMGFTNEAGGYTGKSNLSEGLIALPEFISATRAPAGLGDFYHDSGDWPALLVGHGATFYSLLDIGYEYVGGTTAAIAAGRQTNFGFPTLAELYGPSYAPMDVLPDAFRAAYYFAEYFRKTQDAYGAVASGNSFGSLGFGDGGASENIPSNASAYPMAVSAPDHCANFVYTLVAGKIAIQLYNMYLVSGDSALLAWAMTWYNSAVAANAWGESVWQGLITDQDFYYNTTALNGASLTIIDRTIAANANVSYANAAATQPWTYSPTGTTVNGVEGNGGSNFPHQIITNLTAGAGGTPGIYTKVPLTGGTGTGAEATVVVGALVGGVLVGSTVTRVTITRPGNNYVIGDSLSALSANIGGVTGFSVLVPALTQTTDWNTAFGVVGIMTSTSAVIVGGSGYVPGSYPNVPLNYSSHSYGAAAGTGALATILVGAGGNITTVTITNGGKNYCYLDVFSVNASDVGGTGSGFTYTIKNVQTTAACLQSNSAAYRYNAAAVLFRLAGIVGDSQTSYSNVLFSMSINQAAVGQSSIGDWEIYNAPNNTALKAFIQLANFPSGWGNGMSQAIAGFTAPTNSYKLLGGGIAGTAINLGAFAYGYINDVRANGANEASAVAIRKGLANTLGSTLGANQMGVCVSEGIGKRNTLGVLHRDWQASTTLVSGVQPPPAGLTPYGWANTTNPFGVFNFSSDSAPNWTVVAPTGIWEASNGSKRIVYPDYQTLPMAEGMIENSYCIQIMEFSGPQPCVSNMIGALWLHCADGNTVTV